MILRRSYRFRLEPTFAQAAQFSEICGAVRFVYNLAVEQRRDWWRQYLARMGRHISYASQSGELTQLRAQSAWLDGAPHAALETALQDVDRAYSRFFKGGSGYPGFRKRGQNDSFRLKANIGTRALSEGWAQVRLTKIGWVKYRASRPILGEIKTATVRWQHGHWFLSVMTALEMEAPGALRKAVGIDCGVAHSLSLSNGQTFSVPQSLAREDQKRRRAQRVLTRKKKGSNRRAKQKARIAALGSRIQRIRTDWAHRVSTDIANRFGHVAVEDLKIASMTRAGRGKRGLNRAILHQGWGQVVSLLAYKLEVRGGTLVRVNPAYTSQTCAECGVVDPLSRKNQAAFECVACGHEAHADVNAAINTLRRSAPEQLVERPGVLGLDEARTLENAA